MKRKLIDRKSWLFTTVLHWVNTVAVQRHFARFTVEGTENLPKDGSFLLIANHTARWDGPVVQMALGRTANYMVSPNELKGLQGILLRAVGAFPANPKFDLLSYMRGQAAKGEPIVIFPEGDIYRDGSTHPFKNGAARIALICEAGGLNMPVVPVAIQYAKTAPDTVRILIGKPINVNEYVSQYLDKPAAALHSLSSSLHREVCHLRLTLGERGDNETVFTGKPVTRWVPRLSAPKMPEMLPQPVAVRLER